MFKQTRTIINFNQKYKIKINKTNEKNLNEIFKTLQHFTKTVYSILKYFHNFLEFPPKFFFIYTYTKNICICACVCIKIYIFIYYIILLHLTLKEIGHGCEHFTHFTVCHHCSVPFPTMTLKVFGNFLDNCMDASWSKQCRRKSNYHSRDLRHFHSGRLAAITQCVMEVQK